MVRKILLLENDPGMSEAVAKAASGLGYEIMTAETFLEAKTKMEQEQVDALIVDASFDNGAGARALGYFEGKFGDSKALVITKSVRDQGPRINWANAITRWAS